MYITYGNSVGDTLCILSFVHIRKHSVYKTDGFFSTNPILNPLEIRSRLYIIPAAYAYYYYFEMPNGRCLFCISSRSINAAYPTYL